jgi:hypothetical protein
MRYVKLYESFLNEKTSIPNTLYHGTSKLIKEKMEETKTLFSTFGMVFMLHQVLRKLNIGQRIIIGLIRTVIT